MKKALIILLPLLLATAAFAMWGSFGSLHGGAAAVSALLALDFEYDEFTNATGQVVDSSTYGNHGDPGTGGAQPTWGQASNTMSANIYYDGGDTVSVTVAETHYAHQFWARAASEPWILYTDISTTQYVNGVSGSFTLTNHVTTSGNVLTWGDLYTGWHDNERVFNADIEEMTNFWSEATNHGWLAFDSDNKDQWTDTVFVAGFEYDAGGMDHSAIGTNHAAKGAGAAAPTWGSDGTNAYYSFDGADYLQRDTRIATAYPFTLAVWVKGAADGVAIGLVDSLASDIMYGIGLYTDGKAFLMQRAGAVHRVYSSGVITNSWHHITGVFLNATSGSLYVDGVLETVQTTATAYSANVDRFGVGMWRDVSPSTEFIGLLDDTRIYDVALASNEVFALYNDTKGYHP